MLPPVAYAQVANAAQNGSPLLVSAVGRAFGLGQAETTALVGGKIPGWFWLVVGLAGGIAVGARAQKRWPDKTPKWLSG